MCYALSQFSSLSLHNTNVSHWNWQSVHLLYCKVGHNVTILICLLTFSFAPQILTNLTQIFINHTIVIDNSKIWFSDKLEFVIMLEHTLSSKTFNRKERQESLESIMGQNFEFKSKIQFHWRSHGLLLRPARSSRYSPSSTTLLHYYIIYDLYVTYEYTFNLCFSHDYISEFAYRHNFKIYLNETFKTMYFFIFFLLLLLFE